MLAPSKNLIAAELSFSFYWLLATIVNKALPLPLPWLLGGYSRNAALWKQK